jgi:Putative amidoligase enzyme
MYTRKMNLEDKVGNHMPIQDAATRNPDAYGIEVELEGKNFMEPPVDVVAYWTQVKDGSLRIKAPGDCAIEYVTRSPYPLLHTEKAITALFGYLNSPGVEVYESYRTSIHVHVNFACETFRTIYNFMTLSLILDELLVSQNGEHRIGNNFCLRARDAMGQVQSMIASLNGGDNFFGVNQNDRYSSINFHSLLKFGSIEFRSLECTTHEGRLLHWIGTLTEMKKAAKLFKNPAEVISMFSSVGPRQFLSSVLGPFATKYIEVEDSANMLFNGMRIAQDFAYCSEWNEETQADRDERLAKVKAKEAAYMKAIKKKGFQ